MVDGKKTNNRQISLEQLLRVKRAEQPEPEFWDQFEQEYRQKQLSALVQAQPWFVRLGRTIGMIARRSAPVTAAAAAIATGYFVVSGPSIVTTSPESSPVSERYETIAVRPVESQVVASVGNLPEMIVQPVATRSDRFEARPLPITARARYIEDIMAKDDQPQRYVTLSSPKTLFTGSSPSGTYVVNALSSQTSFGRPSSRTVAQF
ncbi:MAG: hypothetical protein DRP71_00770 [Verrucomicrobia bacterium]|nr:MAG: hypothetical protein DRP71_00770 [Verrucomicrobiota bacterium]